MDLRPGRELRCQWGMGRQKQFRKLEAAVRCGAELTSGCDEREVGTERGRAREASPFPRHRKELDG